MRGRPSKPLSLVKGHRTKAEIEVREKSESAMLTGTAMSEWPEVKASAIAHRRFAAIKDLLGAIQKDDALYEPVINRYCTLTAEVYQLEQTRRDIVKQKRELEKRYKASEVEFLDYMQLSGKLNDHLFACDRGIMAVRKMLLDIEKENIMTIASALRSIPKKAEEKKKSKMAALLEGS
jgi:hypothetical protein